MIQGQQSERALEKRKSLTLSDEWVKSTIASSSARLGGKSEEAPRMLKRVVRLDTKRRWEGGILASSKGEL